MKKNIRTDLALEAHELTKKESAGEIEGVIAKEWQKGEVKITEVDILNDLGEKAIGKSKGTYITIEAPKIRYSSADFENVCYIISDEIKKMAKITSDSMTLVVGLGNRQITPDALGSEVLNNLFVTRHMKNLLEESAGNVCAIAPGVLGTTGIESMDIINSICQKIKPDLIIAVDALAAGDIKRMSTTIQIADTGIQPGSGVGNDRKGLNHQTLGVKVIAIGVPTVIDAANISDIQIPQEIAPLMVTSKDIDCVIKKMSKAIACGINLALHKNMSLEDISALVG